MTATDALALEPDLTLSECCDRWGVSSRNSIKARAAALGVELRRESSTRTVWPAQYLPLGDDLNAHLRNGGTLASFPRALSVPPSTDASDAIRTLSVPPSTDASDRGLMALAQLAAALAPAAPADPLVVARGLMEAAELEAWLTPAELAQLLGVAPATVRSWRDGHCPRPGFELQRRKVGTSVWWAVRPITDGTD